MAFTYDPSPVSWTDLNWFRLRLGDTDPTFPLFSDAILTAILGKATTASGTNFDHALGIALRVLAVDPVRLVESQKAAAGGISLIDELDNYQRRSEVFID